MKQKHYFHMFVYKNKHLSSFFFLILSTRALRRAVESVVRVRTSTQNTSMQKVKTNSYRYNFKVLASKMRVQPGTGRNKRNQSTFSNGAYKLASGVLTLLFFFRLFDLIFLSLNIQKKCTRIRQLNNYKTVSEMKLLMYTHAA